MEATLTTPRPVPMTVTAAAFNTAEALFKQRQLRDCAVALLESEHAVSSSSSSSSSGAEQEPLKDAGDLMCTALGGLREDPWLMLGVKEPATARSSSTTTTTTTAAAAAATTSDEDVDREIKVAFRKLALKLHPDKNRNLDTTALFACLYASYEKVGTAAARAAFWKERAEEARQKKEARAKGGVDAAEALEKRFAKERLRRERKAMANWKVEQKATFTRWATSDRALAREAEEKETFRQRQKVLDAGRQRRASKLEDKAHKRRSDHKKAVSQKIQRQLQREEDEARAAMALLEQRAAKLRAEKQKARADGNRFEAFAERSSRRPKSSSSSSSSSNGGGGGGRGRASGTKLQQQSSAEDVPLAPPPPLPSPPPPSSSSSSSSSSSHASTQGHQPSLLLLPKGVGGGRRTPRIHRGEMVEVTFDCEGPMGFTLGDMAAIAVEKGAESRKEKDWRSTAEKENNGRGDGGGDDDDDNDDDDDDDEQESGQDMGNDEDGEDDEEESSWAASVVGFVKSRGLCEAQRLGLRHGDVLRTVNGYDMQGVRFKELCTFLGRSDFPRTLCFHRPGPSK